MGKVAKLIFISSANNNKFYNMTENEGSGTFDVEYGRVGANPQKTSYPMSKWNSTLNSKTKKGYKDNTDLFVLESVDNPTNTDSTIIDFISSRTSAVINIVKKLQSWAKGSIEQNYTVSSENVTEKQVERAQALLDQIAQFNLTKTNVNDFNNMLIEFYGIVPRKMKQVKDHLVSDTDQLDTRKNTIVGEEQDTLDVMSGQVTLQKQLKESNNNEVTSEKTQTDIISASGLEILEVTDKLVIDKIKSMMQDNAHKFKCAYEVINNKTQSKYDNHIKNVKNTKQELFWHGSRNENWWSILTSGLLIRPSNAVHTGSMFGDGIYYADKFQKSYGYTSGRNSYWVKGNSNEAVLALYNVHVGEQKHIKHHNSSCYKLSANVLKDEGFDSVFAHGGADLRNNEYIVYKAEQNTIKYLVIVEA